MRTVDSRVYTKNYYLSDCNHYQEFLRSNGQKLGDRFVQLLPYINIEPGMKILDIGSGRGEMCIYAASLGAEAVGVDYSTAAIDLANQATKKLPQKVAQRIKFIKSPVTEMDFEDESFDGVICVEVLEHLYPEEIDKMLKLVNKLLKPGSKAIFHTAPNKWFNDIGYRFWSYPVGSNLIKLSNWFTKSDYPAMAPVKTLRTESHKIMHVNEPTYFSLEKQFSRFDWDFLIQSLNITAVKPILSWKDRLFNLLVYMSPLSKWLPFNIIFGDDFLITTTKRID